MPEEVHFWHWDFSKMAFKITRKLGIGHRVSNRNRALFWRRALIDVFVKGGGFTIF